MEFRDKTLFLISIVILCLLATAFLPLYFKTLFVEESGRLTVLSPWVAVVLVLAFYYKKSWVRKATIVFNALAVIMLTVIIGMGSWKDYKVIGLSFLLLLQVVSIIILRTVEVKNFLKEKIKSQFPLSNNNR
jgi:hypothetical protein